MKTKIILGIDTSCYTTSIAAINLNGEIIYQNKIMLNVKKGQRGLRQSDGIYQHMNNIGAIFENFPKEFELLGICASTRPRSQENSYMPVFNFGYNWAKSISDMKKTPLYTTSHQDGHIEAARYDTKIESSRFIVVHMSGGTTEILLVQDGGIKIIGGTKDISAGQLIDRIGVKFGDSFPAGKYVDERALGCSDIKPLKFKTSVQGSWMNISGIESQSYRLIDENSHDPESICLAAMESLSISISKALVHSSKEHGFCDVLFTGGVSSSGYLKKSIKSRLQKENIATYWPKSEFAKDNAAGCAIIGFEKYKNEGGRCEA